MRGGGTGSPAAVSAGAEQLGCAGPVGATRRDERSDARASNRLIEPRQLHQRIRFEPLRGQHKSNTSAVVGEDQHGDNTDKLILSGTRRHACHGDRACAVTSKDAGELG